MSAEPMRAADVCKLLGVARSTLNTWRSRGQLDVGHKPNGPMSWTLYTPEDVEKIRAFMLTQEGTCPHCGGSLP